MELRRKAVRLHLEEGLTLRLVSEETGVSRDTICYWVQRYRKQGEAGLEVHPGRRGPAKPKLPPAVHEAILAVKRENGSNLTSWQVNKLLADWGIVDLTSPPYYPRYNGAVEYAQREIKIVAKILHETHGLPLKEALAMAPQVINRRSRPCLHGATATEVFHTHNPALSRAFTEENRKETTHWIEERQGTILASMSASNRHTQAAAKRLATETWLLNQDLVVPVRTRTVSPLFR